LAPRIRRGVLAGARGLRLAVGLELARRLPGVRSLGVRLLGARLREAGLAAGFGFRELRLRFERVALRRPAAVAALVEPIAC